MDSTVVKQQKKNDQDIVYLYSPLTSPFSFNPLMDFEFHHWPLLKRITTYYIEGVAWELTPLNYCRFV